MRTLAISSRFWLSTKFDSLPALGIEPLYRKGLILWLMTR